MNVQLLIDAIVRQTTVLVAQLATAGGLRAPLAGVANQVFLDLSNELYAQGVSRKVSADMFGMALRTYLRKIQRARESSTDRGRSLWEALLAFLEDNRLVSRGEVLQRFHRDEPEIVRAVLHDLVEGGLVLKLGSGPRTAYRAATREELTSLQHEANSDGTDELLWALIFREGPIAHDDLAALARSVDLEAALGRLIASGRVHRSKASGTTVYSAREFFVPLASATGWEAAVWDHFQAVVKTIGARLCADGSTNVGGSTYSFVVWPGHPYESEVLGLLGELRERTGALKKKVSAYNATHKRPRQHTQVTFYGGQWQAERTVGDDEDGGSDEQA